MKTLQVVPPLPGCNIFSNNYIISLVILKTNMDILCTFRGNTKNKIRIAYFNTPSKIIMANPRGLPRQQRQTKSSCLFNYRGFGILQLVTLIQERVVDPFLSHLGICLWRPATEIPTSVWMKCKQKQVRVKASAETIKQEYFI